MKNMVKVIAGAIALSMPLAANAQVATGIAVSFGSDNSFRTGARGYGANGGGYFASFTVDLGNGQGARTFNDWLLWCIDGDRSISPNSTHNFSFYTVDQFAATTLGAKGGLHDPDLGDMKSIADLSTFVATNWNGLSEDDRRRYQGSIWSEWDGYTTYNNNAALGSIIAGNRNFNTRDYYVVWNGAQQTFITYVPEPSSVVLLIAGMAGLMVAVRRRNNIA